MRTSRTIPLAVYLAEQRINALVDFERRDSSVAQLANTAAQPPPRLTLLPARNSTPRSTGAAARLRSRETPPRLAQSTAARRAVAAPLACPAQPAARSSTR